MLVFRYWLKKLSYCFTENFKFEQGFINPDILELFFGDAPLKFHTKYFYLYHKEGLDYSVPGGFEFMYHHVVIHGRKGFHYDDSKWKMFGEMVNEEERYFPGEEEEEKVFCKVVEYEMFRVDDPEIDDLDYMYLCFRIGSKKAFHFENFGIIYLCNR
ncbi:unnamed protein product [Meloidogyne enterolobii]|uniref:Uncharacterized protein n=1 Tax=Meloidogyne enterolobii TaxID=390850 RepID=A0ACB0YJF2_MELEN